MTVRRNSVHHDAFPYDGYRYRLRLTDGRIIEPVQARWSYSGASIVFPAAGESCVTAMNEHDPHIAAVERLT